MCVRDEAVVSVRQSRFASVEAAFEAAGDGPGSSLRTASNAVEGRVWASDARPRKLVERAQ